MNLPSLDLSTLSAAYAAGTLTPADVVALVHTRVAARGADHVWLHLVPRDTLLAEAARLERRRAAGEALPLYGAPFAVKDNIDVAGLPTTAACPDFSYTATETAPVVQRLLDAGALLVGKTNLDQFATGLVGTRSPYGAPSCVFDERHISGGSSSGSAVAVAAGLVSFALGTDTAGSGRVPAAFNQLVGFKPTRGLLSSRGIVPACRSLDCPSVLALTCADAAAVMRVARAPDELDPYSRTARTSTTAPRSFRFGVPSPGQLEFFGDDAAAALFAEAVARLERIGGTRVEIDFTPFRETADLLYAGPWVAERLAAIEPFLDAHPHSLLPVTAQIIRSGRRYSAADAFRALHRLEELRRRTLRTWATIDTLLVPTAGTIYSHAQVAAEPVRLNNDLGYYTNFVNLLDLCGVAVPAGLRAEGGKRGLPFGVTLLAPAFADDAVCALAARFHHELGGTLGGTGVHLHDLTAAAEAGAAGLGSEAPAVIVAPALDVRPGSPALAHVRRD